MVDFFPSLTYAVWHGRTLVFFSPPPIPSGPESETFSKRKSILEEEGSQNQPTLRREGRFFGHLAAGRFPPSLVRGLTERHDLLNSSDTLN